MTREHGELCRDTFLQAQAEFPNVHFASGLEAGSLLGRNRFPEQTVLGYRS